MSRLLDIALRGSSGPQDKSWLRRRGKCSVWNAHISTCSKCVCRVLFNENEPKPPAHDTSREKHCPLSFAETAPPNAPPPNLSASVGDCSSDKPSSRDKRGVVTVTHRPAQVSRLECRALQKTTVAPPLVLPKEMRNVVGFFPEPLPLEDMLPICRGVF